MIIFIDLQKTVSSKTKQSEDNKHFKGRERERDKASVTQKTTITVSRSPALLSVHARHIAPVGSCGFLGTNTWC